MPDRPGLDADLATLRRFHTGERWLDKEADAAWPRVEAELARLREEWDGWRATADEFTDKYVLANGDKEAAVAECARLDDKIRDALDVLTGFSRPMTQAERISFATRVLNEALAGPSEPDTPADSQPEETTT